MPEPTPKQALEDVLTKAMVKEIWTASFPELVPFTLQQFTVGAVLPAVMYMFRRGKRRGAGNFRIEFAPIVGPIEKGGEITVKDQRSKGKKAEPSITSVVRVLASDSERFDGFVTKTGRDILADLLLCHCFENRQHESGRHHPLIRIFPTHYLSSWIDIPVDISNLRDVPESLVSMLTEQKQGAALTTGECKDSWFRVGSDFEHNLLLQTLGHGMKFGASANDMDDEFDEVANVGVDQLLTIRVAKKCAAPETVRKTSQKSKGEGIPNRHPIARYAARGWNQDFRLFLQAYGESLPRQCLLPMLESSIGLGLTNIFLSTAKMLLEWEKTGTLPQAQSPAPWPLFVDCSSGSDRNLRRVAEESLEECERLLRRIPVILMALRIIEDKASSRIEKMLPPKRPDITNRINELGEIIHGRHSKSAMLLDDLAESCHRIVRQLDGATGVDDVIAMLNEDSSPNPVWRLAEAVTLMMGEKAQTQAVNSCLKSCMMLDEANGIAAQRNVRFSTGRKGKMSGTVRSVVLTNTMLDFLVHRHLRQPGKKGRTQPNPLAFSGNASRPGSESFLRILREQYGLCIDQAPPGQQISVELLLRNRRVLEARLRDLGLLVGVNDAESMKRLQPRFEAREPEAAHDNN